MTFFLSGLLVFAPAQSALPDLATSAKQRMSHADALLHRNGSDQIDPIKQQQALSILREIAGDQQLPSPLRQEAWTLLLKALTEPLTQANLHKVATLEAILKSSETLVKHEEASVYVPAFRPSAKSLAQANLLSIELLEEQPKNTQLLILRATALELMQDYDGSKKHLDKAMDAFKKLQLPPSEKWSAMITASTIIDARAREDERLTNLICDRSYRGFSLWPQGAGGFREHGVVNIRLNKDGSVEGRSNSRWLVKAGKLYVYSYISEYADAMKCSGDARICEGLSAEGLNVRYTQIR